MIAIACMGANRVIGNRGKLPWPRIPGELAWFKEATMDGTLVMGRKTFESLPGLLPGRKHVVLTRSPWRCPEGKVTCLPRLPQHLDGKVFLIGGGQMYKKFLPRCEELWLSVLPDPYPGDTFFPGFETKFTLTQTTKNQHFEVRKYKRNE